MIDPPMRSFSPKQLFGAMAWFWLMVPIVQSAWILSKGGKRLVGAHMSLAAVSLIFVC